MELPDHLLKQAKSRAAMSGVSLRQFFIEAIENRLAPESGKTRRDPPVLGGPKAPRLGVLTAEQIDEAMFG
ncbi:MAG TPA: hypothetical protein VG273_02615 [Bryobacteraceae bacterium]|nr:hypothetical protein [Bryobacteraceae bacterium]